MGYRYCYDCDHEFWEHQMNGNKCPKCGSTRWGLLHRLQRQAHSAVSVALKNGTITKTVCVVCGADRVEGHHDDYSKPLEVVWLCRPHHGERHAALRKEGRDPNLTIRFRGQTP